MHPLDALPRPPRFDTWPVAVQHAMRLRGALLRCGPGYRGAGWPDSPAVRLAALAPWGEQRLIASHLTAAWVWGAAREPTGPLTFATRHGRRSPLTVGAAERRFELRLSEAEIARLGAFEVTTPLRTVLDLLRDPRGFDRAEAAICRLLLRLVGERNMLDGEAQLTVLLGRRHPGNRIARERHARWLAPHPLVTRYAS